MGVHFCVTFVLTIKSVSSKSGGPKVPEASLENPYPSLGIPSQFVSNSSFLFGSTPKHPRGCAREAWISQAQYWLDEIDKLIPGTEITTKIHCQLGFALLFITAYKSLLNRLGIKQ